MATKQTDWDAAAAVMSPYEAANSWKPGTPPELITTIARPATAESKSGHVLISAATEAYIKEHQRAESSFNTQRKLRYLMTAIEQYSAEIGLRTIEEWTPALVRQFRNSWNVSSLTSSRMLGNVKAFFEFCLENEWVTRNPARIKVRQNRNLLADDTQQRQKLPFTDDELERMYEGCRDYGKTTIREWPRKRDGRQVEAIAQFREYKHPLDW